MSHITIADLAHKSELNAEAMASVRGGYGYGYGSHLPVALGKVADVNVGVYQNISQQQNVEVNALNNVGVIGAKFGPLHLDVSPSQWANAEVAL